MKKKLISYEEYEKKMNKILNKKLSVVNSLVEMLQVSCKYDIKESKTKKGK